MCGTPFDVEKKREVKSPPLGLRYISRFSTAAPEIKSLFSQVSLKASLDYSRKTTKIVVE